jgi:glycosyltransferase involved in cell wall biosynthesis
MKVLLSAYACEPGKGSEPGLGWSWAISIAELGHDVHVVTRANNRASIDRAIKEIHRDCRVTFHYYDLPKWQSFWKRGNRGVLLYNLLWQWGAAKVARGIHRRENFDVVHHITFASSKLPSFMGSVGGRFIFGPVGGGELTPPSLRATYPLRGRIVDALRAASIHVARVDPLMRSTYRRADEIWLRSTDNVHLVPRRERRKIRFSMGIGVSVPECVSVTGRSPQAEVRFLYIGRFLYWKGMHLGLQAFAEAARSASNLRLTMVGKGAEEQRLRRQALKLGISHLVDWSGWVPHDRVAQLYNAHDALLFPSLHDSGGMVVLEAAMAGLPTICLDTGGPGATVHPSWGIKVAVRNRPASQVIDELALEITAIASDAARRAQMARAAQQWAKEMSWLRQAQEIYSPVLAR